MTTSTVARGEGETTPLTNHRRAPIMGGDECQAVGRQRLSLAPGATWRSRCYQVSVDEHIEAGMPRTRRPHTTRICGATRTGASARAAWGCRLCRDARGLHDVPCGRWAPVGHAPPACLCNLSRHVERGTSRHPTRQGSSACSRHEEEAQQDGSVGAKKAITLTQLLCVDDAIEGDGSRCSPRSGESALGFACALRRAELLVLRWTSRSGESDGILVAVTRSKTHQEGKGDYVDVPCDSCGRSRPRVDGWRGGRRAKGLVQRLLWRRGREAVVEAPLSSWRGRCHSPSVPSAPNS